MDTSIMIIIVVISLVAFLTFYVIGAYNRLVNSKNIVNDKWNEIDKQLKNKTELVPKMIEIVKSYAIQEEAIFMSLLAERNRITKAFSINDKIEANKKLSQNLELLLNLENNYKKLSQDDKFKTMVEELSKIDSKIDYSCEFYNNVVVEHNNKISKFPIKIVAVLFKFKKYELFER